VAYQYFCSAFVDVLLCYYDFVARFPSYGVMYETLTNQSLKSTEDVRKMQQGETGKQRRNKAKMISFDNPS
jgi:hypothetical protein